MTDCESLPKCPFFNDKMANMPANAEREKRDYCQTDNTHCARRLVSQALGRDRVPADLSPGNFERARVLIAGG